MSLLFFFILFE